MATLFMSLVSATSAVELAEAREADPRTHLLAAHPTLPAVLILHALRSCPWAGEELGYYTAGQARRLLAGSDSLVACACLVREPGFELPVTLAA
jgi:hypothetical protein